MWWMADPILFFIVSAHHTDIGLHTHAQHLRTEFCDEYKNFYAQFAQALRSNIKFALIDCNSDRGMCIVLVLRKYGNVLAIKDLFYPFILQNYAFYSEYLSGLHLSSMQYICA